MTAASSWRHGTLGVSLAGIDADFVQDNLSESSQYTLRGLHYQIEQAQGKLVRVAQGEVFDVAVDLRKSSPSFGRWTGWSCQATTGSLFGCHRGLRMVSLS